MWAVNKKSDQISVIISPNLKGQVQTRAFFGLNFENGKFLLMMRHGGDPDVMFMSRTVV